MPILRPEDADEVAERLRTVVRQLDVSCGTERSVKLVGGVIDDNRFLLSFPANPSLRRELCGCLETFGFPDALRADFETAASTAFFFHLGFAAVDGDPQVKAYCEAPLAGRSRQRVHVAFKWSVRDPARFAIDDYWLQPDMSLASMNEIISAHLRDEHGGGLRTCLWLLERASRVLPAEELVFLEVERRGGGRRSFDLRVYGSGLVVADAFTVDDLSGAGALLALSGGHTLGHASGGRDDLGRAFVTLYFDAEDFE